MPKRKANPLERVARDKKTGRFKKLRKHAVPASVVPVRPTRKPKPVGSFVDDEMRAKTSVQDKQQIQARTRRQRKQKGK